MDSFLKEFFPDVYRGRRSKNNYCRYEDQFLQFYTSSLYLAALLSCITTPYPSRVWGRRKTILLSGIIFMVGTCIGAGALNIGMLLSGRILQGLAIGMSVQVCLQLHGQLLLRRNEVIWTPLFSPYSDKLAVLKT